MKRLLFSLLAFTFLSLSVYGQINEYHPGTVILRIKSQYRSQCEETSVNLPEFNQIYSRLNGTSIQKMFPYLSPPTTEFSGRGRKMEDLSLMYKLQFNASIPLDSATTWLKESGLVDFADPERVYHSMYTTNDPLMFTTYPGVEMEPYTIIKAREAWDVEKGSRSVIIGNSDTGVEWNHEDLVDNIYQNLNEDFDKDGHTIELIGGVWQLDPGDLNGVDDDNSGYADDLVGRTGVNAAHGTAVASFHSATPDNGKGIAGTGYNCRYVMAPGLGLHTVVYLANLGASIINCSWGGYTTSPQIYESELAMIRFVVNNKDAVIIAAAGNNNTPGLYTYPASYDEILSVAASVVEVYNDNFTTDEKAHFSTFNNLVDIIAPGRALIGCLPNNSYSFKPLRQSGTSFSSPIVAGAAGLLRSKFPDLNEAQVRALLRNTADDIYSVGWNSTFPEGLGKGRLNMYRSLTEFPVAVTAEGKEKGACKGRILTCTFTNQLKATSNLQATISSMTPGITIKNPTVTLGAMATLGEKIQDFEIIVDPAQISLPKIVLFRLAYTDAANSYTDYQYIYVQLSNINEPYLSSITGKTQVCPRDMDVVYSVNYTPGSTYQWVVPQGAIITAGLHTNSIKVYFNSSFNGGEISVKEITYYGCQSATEVLTIARDNNCPVVSPDCMPHPSWSSYFGSSKTERIFGVGSDPKTGDVLVIGGTDDQITLPKGQIPNKAFGPLGGRDVFVAKIKADGSKLVWVTVLGGSGFDQGQKVIVTEKGDVVVSGLTGAPDFFVKPKGRKYGTLGNQDAFCAMLNGNDGNVSWSTLFGGTEHDLSEGMVLDESKRRIYLGGQTNSLNLPKNENSLGGNFDAFCARVSLSNGALEWTAYLGGPGTEDGWGAALDSEGNPYITGFSNTDFAYPAVPKTNGFGGNWDMICAKFNRNGKMLWHTFVGGPNSEAGTDLTVTPSDNVIVVGQSTSTPLNGIWTTVSTNNFLFVSLNGKNGSVNFNRSLGGSDHERAESVSVDKAGNIYVAGSTKSHDFISALDPLNPNAFMNKIGGDQDGFVVKFDNSANANPLWATFLGGTGREFSMGVAPDKDGNVLVGGATWKGDFPAMNSTVQPEFKGATGHGDGYIVKLSSCDLIQIVGKDELCWKETTTYQVIPANASSTYIWSLPEGLNKISQTPGSITVTVSSSFAGGLVSVYEIKSDGTKGTPNVKLLEKGANCCPGVIADFTYKNLNNPKYPESICFGTTIELKGNSTGMTYEEWYINGNSIGTGNLKYYVFNNPGEFVIELRAVNTSLNCMSAKTLKVVVNNTYHTGEIIGPDEFCGSSPLHYSLSTTEGAREFIWMHEGQVAGTGSSVTITPNINTSTISLMVTSRDMNGCPGTYQFKSTYNTCPGQSRAGTLSDNSNALVYPNPFSEDAYLDLSSYSGSTVKIRVFDAQGSMIHERDSFNEDRITIGKNLKEGIYFVKIDSEEKSETITIVKNK